MHGENLAGAQKFEEIFPPFLQTIAYKSDSKIDLQRYQLFLLSFTNTEQWVVVFAIPFH
jgi:hypothetical protein